MRALVSVGLVVGGAALAASLGWACADPVHGARVDALGSESGSPGPTHRPGQPCLTCHGGGGPASAEFTVAGTIYQNAAADSPPLAGGTVTIYDATESPDGGAAPHTAVTNAAGNFYITRSAWSPVYPLHDISVGYPGVDTPTLMHGVVGRDGSCSTCHFQPKGPDSHGHVYFVLEATDFPGATP